MDELKPGEMPVKCQAVLVAHQANVNVVRFSPNGECLASASDGAWRGSV